MNIALFGGGFDPVHIGHVALAKGMADDLHLDRVIWMPTGLSPHKQKRTETTGEQRLAMCRLAAEDDRRFCVSDDEISRGGASFTADTLRRIKDRFPRDKIFLLTGSDMFLTLSSWKDFEVIARLAVLCTAPRDGENIGRLFDYARELADVFGARCEVRDLAVPSVSSTEIRAAVRAGKSVVSFVPQAVADYIVREGLYRKEDKGMGDEQLREIVQSRLTDKRYHHSLCVAQEAKRLAERYGADPAKAYTAGLVHDIMKNTDEKAQLQILRDFGILLDDVERVSPKLYHARTGAVFLEKVLGINDSEILLAVRYHTTARAGMGILEQILYLADFTSADRDYDDVAIMRRLVDEDKDKALQYALSYTIRELVDARCAVHPDTLSAYNEIILRLKEDGEDGKGQAQ